MSDDIKIITLLHANDIHGQLSFTVGKDLKLYGGISMTADYIRRTREEGPTFFGICGDVLQEDVWGSDYKGTNTVSMINLLRPDAISLGNHELDYGLAHLLIFNECIKSPILCANVMVSKLEMSLFTPSMIYEVGGVRLLLIGVIPRGFFLKIVSDSFCKDMLEYKDSYEAIREETTRHAGEYDLVVLMSHYGIEGDTELVKELPPDIHIDLLLGGHSHINMDEALYLNGIPVAQSSYGTTHIGRFDLAVDVKKKCIHDWKWERVAISEDNCGSDAGVDELADRVVFDRKREDNSGNIAIMDRTYFHKSRLYETELGRLVADIFLDSYPVDLVIIQSGSLRSDSLGPDVTEKALKKLYPFDDSFLAVNMTGKEIKEAFCYLFSLKPDGLVMNGTFQYSRGFHLTADFTDCWNKGCKVLELSLNEQEFEDEKIYRVGVTANCLKSFLKYFGICPPENARKVSLSTYCDLARWMLAQEEPVCVASDVRFTILNYEE